MKETFQFLVVYTNDVRQVEVKASSEKQALETVYYRAKKALMHVVSIQTIF